MLPFSYFVIAKYDGSNLVENVQGLPCKHLPNRQFENEVPRSTNNDDGTDDNDGDEISSGDTNNHNEELDLLQKQLQTGEGSHSWTPLMFSCARAPPHVIETLLKCCPESAQCSD